jgi:hypothetical protein
MMSCFGGAQQASISTSRPLNNNNNNNNNKAAELQ